MNKLLTFAFIAGFWLLTSLPVIGQPPSHANKPNNNGNGVPIDGGASWLAAAGAAYGVKKYRDYRKKQSDENEPLL